MFADSGQASIDYNIKHVQNYTNFSFTTSKNYKVKKTFGSEFPQPEEIKKINTGKGEVTSIVRNENIGYSLLGLHYI